MGWVIPCSETQLLWQIPVGGQPLSLDQEFEAVLDFLRLRAFLGAPGHGADIAIDEGRGFHREISSQHLAYVSCWTAAAEGIPSVMLKATLVEWEFSKEGEPTTTLSIRLEQC